MTDTATTDTSGYDVGGYRLDRPFKIRRFGHFGFNVQPLDECLAFYTDVLGFRLTDAVHLFDYLEGRGLAAAKEIVTDDRMFFTGYAGDHHALLLAHTTFGTFNRNDRGYPDNTVSQITWQVSTLAEVVAAEAYLQASGAKIVRVGRDMPGGNWHVYFLDPDGNTVELYYGMEQIGWSRRSRPRAMHDEALAGAPALPARSEMSEVYAAQDAGIDTGSGWQPDERHLESKYDVGGTLLPRPFKIVELGPVAIYAERIDEMFEFYTSTMGFKLTESALIDGHRVVHLRHGIEHHSLVIADKDLRGVLGTTATTSNLFIGVRVGSYQQLRAAVEFLSASSFERAHLPVELSLGQGYVAYFRDPAGHLVQLSCEMEQVGWQGEPRPSELRRPLLEPWPATLDGDLGAYDESPFWGPLG